MSKNRCNMEILKENKMGLLIAWNSILTVIVVFLFIFMILIFAKIIDEIEAIKSWYPFCELMKIKIDKGELNGKD